jgi:hypothetical protein
MVKMLPFSWERLIGMMEKVRERLGRAVRALEAGGIPYAVVGGNAVAAWVSLVDEGKIRNTSDVNLLLRRGDLDAATLFLEKEGFVRAEVLGVPMFLDGPNGKPSQAIHILVAEEKVRPEYVEPTPSVEESEMMKDWHSVSLEALVRMKLTSFRDKDRTHLRDLIGVDLVDPTWPARLHPVLAARLQQLLDTPEG